MQIRKLLTQQTWYPLLDQFSKILEKLFEIRLSSFIKKHKLINEHQYGFQENRSTEMAVIELVEKLTSAIENNNYSIGIFIDLKKAFDTIDHKTLLKKTWNIWYQGPCPKMDYWLSQE